MKTHTHTRTHTRPAVPSNLCCLLVSRVVCMYVCLLVVVAVVVGSTTLMASVEYRRSTSALVCSWQQSRAATICHFYNLTLIRILITKYKSSDFNNMHNKMYLILNS